MKRILPIICILSVVIFVIPTNATTNTVWLTTAFNTNPWPGTSNAPYYVGTAQLYTDLLVTNNHNYTFNYKPGTYTTWGAPTARTAGDGCIHRGATDGTTTIKLAPLTNGWVNAIFSTRETDFTDTTVNSFELHNLVLDCDANNQLAFQARTPSKWIGVSLGGNNIVCSNVQFIHFGVIGASPTDNECFPFIYYLTHTNHNANNPPTAFGNVRVDSCVFRDAATNNDGSITCCALLNGQDEFGDRLTVTNTLVTNCTVLDIKTNFNYNTVGFDAYNVANCFVRGCDIAIYLEQGPDDYYDYNQDVLLHDNFLTNVFAGLRISSGLDPKSHFPLSNVIFSNNQVYLTTDTWHAGVEVYWSGTNYQRISRLTVTDNVFMFNGSQQHPGLTTMGVMLNICDSACVAFNTFNLGCDVDLVVNTNTMRFFSFFENRDTNTVLLPIKYGVDGTSFPIIGTQQRSDFNLDGKPDFLFYDKLTGSNYVWQMNGLTLGGQFAITNSGTAWGAAATCDFNGDGLNDLFMHGTNGGNAIWILGGSPPTNVVKTISLPTLNTNWAVGGVGDFNGDGKYDVLWRYYAANGTNMVWLMDGTNVTQSVLLSTLPDLTWKIAGVGDFDLDRHQDILLQQLVTNTFGFPFKSVNLNQAVWLMNGTNFFQSISLATYNVNSFGGNSNAFRAAGVGDFYTDGGSHIAFFTTGSSFDGPNFFWLMSRTNRSGTWGFGSSAIAASVQVAGPK